MKVCEYSNTSMLQILMQNLVKLSEKVYSNQNMIKTFYKYIYIYTTFIQIKFQETIKHNY